jgi:hypothetical protein
MSIRYIAEALIAAVTVFAGSLLSDHFFGDGIQGDDIDQAIIAGIIAGVVQFALHWRNRRPD